MNSRPTTYVQPFYRRCGELVEGETRAFASEHRAAWAAHSLHRRAHAVVVFTLDRRGEPETLATYGTVPGV